MKVKSLKKYLKDVPDNYDVELGSVYLFVCTKPNEEYEIILDNPIIGIAKHEESKHLRFMLDSKDLNKRTKGYFTKNLGKIKRI
jgi:hypothetical protein